MIESWRSGSLRRTIRFATIVGQYQYTNVHVLIVSLIYLPLVSIIPRWTFSEARAATDHFVARSETIFQLTAKSAQTSTADTHGQQNRNYHSHDR